MKKLISILAAIFISSFLYAQNSELIGTYFQFTNDLNLFEIEKVDNSIDKKTSEKPAKPVYVFTGEQQLVNENTLFRVVDIHSQFYIIEVYKKNKGDDKETTTVIMLGLTENEKLLNTKKYEGEKPRWSFVSSAITLPVKVRFGDNKNEVSDETRYLNFEGNINIGLTAGVRRRLSENGHFYLSGLVGFNVGSTKINAETTDDFISTETNASILSPFAGVLLEYLDFQVGLFVGWDHLSGATGRKWDYQGKSWLGLGIGYNIFTSKTETPNITKSKAMGNEQNNLLKI